MTKHKFLFVFLIICSISFVDCKNAKHKQNAYAHLPAEVAEVYKQLEKNPNNPSLYVQLTDYYIKNSLLDSALNNILIAIRLDSTHSDYYLKLSDVYFAMQRIDDTEEILEKVISMDKSNKEAYLKLAELHFLHKRYKEAHEQLNAVLSIDVFNPKAYFIRGWIQKEEGDTAAAIRSYLTAVEQNPDYFEAYEELGIVYHTKRDPLAVSYYKNALNIQPENTQVLYNLAMYYQEIGDNDNAIKNYQMILQINPKHPYALHNIGWIFMVKQQKYEEAVAFFTKAIEADTTYVDAVYNRGLAFESLKRFDNARQDYAYSLKLNDKYMLAIEGLNRLDKLQKK